LKSAQANSLREPISKKSNAQKKKSGGVVQGQSPEFKPQYHTHTKKNTQHKTRAGRVVQVVEPLSSKPEAQNSSPSTAKKKKERKRETDRKKEGKKERKKRENTQNRTCGVTQVVEHHLSRCKALNSIPSTANNQEVVNWTDFTWSPRAWSSCEEELRPLTLCKSLVSVDSCMGIAQKMEFRPFCPLETVTSKRKTFRASGLNGAGAIARASGLERRQTGKQVGCVTSHHEGVFYWLPCLWRRK
jgi:hypothetical protein